MQPFFAVEFQQRRDKFVEVALHGLIELVQRQVDAVVGHAVLRKVVRANPLAAISRADLQLALRGAGIVQFLRPLFEQPAAQDPHGAGLVLVLALFILAFDDEPRSAGA